MTGGELAALRGDFNVRGVGVLRGPYGCWFATTPTGDVIAAGTAGELRRKLRVLDGTTAADTQTLPRIPAP